MSSALFSVVEHDAPSQYVREFPHSARSDDAPLRLVIKQYVPRDQVEPLPAGAVTILTAHAIGVPKVLRRNFRYLEHTFSSLGK